MSGAGNDLDNAPKRQALAEAEQLRVAIGRFVRTMRTGEHLPAGQAAALGHLSRSGDLAITELAEREHVRHQSMARTVKLMGEQGLIEVAPDAMDRRRVLARITAEGEKRLRVDRDARSTRIAEAMVARLSPAERDLLRQVPALLEKLAAYEG